MGQTGGGLDPGSIVAASEIGEACESCSKKTRT
jgi:hypothetical protein